MYYTMGEKITKNQVAGIYIIVFCDKKKYFFL